MTARVPYRPAPRGYGLLVEVWTHRCLRCGAVLARDSPYRTSPATCAGCAARPAVVHPNWSARHLDGLAKGATS